ncbi:angiopoietin-related protein 2b [Pseudoliparis swirei]|uniref:angiopoietin-related protein 2b n=1 Tax=Pseudoliparis swirei TaxID=2059687 RepID=UPI0024BEFDB7|nr:angiopoietin-related protein 2b [Pseudoliparis swirei]XP_056275725.1 angiopoietin-related protein 2b [Pseudoliparis swirei]
MEPPSMVLLGLLFFHGLVACGAQQTHGSPSDSSRGRERTQEFESSEDDLESEFLYAGRTKRAPVEQPQDKCSYTFIVPQQKVTGAICVNSKEPEAMLENRVNKQELELLNVELRKQKRQIETMQQLVEVDGGIVNEVKLLRKESRNMNSRVTQLYMQLLHEIIRKRDNALELSQMENKILNQTSEMQQLTGRYKDLDHKYQHLASLATNQSSLIVLLEQQCQSRPRPRPVPVPQPRSQPPIPSPPLTKPYQPPVLPRTSKTISNEIQSDQKSIVPLPTMPTGTHSPSTTDKPSGPFKDCLQALDDGHTSSTMYLVKPENANRLMQVWCDQRHDPGGWTVIQRRVDGSVNFFRNWETYKQGFGNIDGEYWLGLENIYWLTNQANYKLLVTLEDWSGRKVFAEYASFRVESEADFYKLRVGRYHGNAGDSLTWHNGKQFTTLDRDHDTYTGNCAHYQKGGWWYNSCAHSNLNGVWYRGGHYRSRYQDGVYWAEFRGGAYSLKKVVMMIRPNLNTFH